MATKKENTENKEVTGTEEFFMDKGITMDSFVFMDKTAKVLEIGFETEKNIVLYGPGE
jgi:hypothetical protein